jgi:hypothetical protein
MYLSRILPFTGCINIIYISKLPNSLAFPMEQKHPCQFVSCYYLHAFGFWFVWLLVWTTMHAFDFCALRKLQHWIFCATIISVFCLKKLLYLFARSSFSLITLFHCYFLLQCLCFWDQLVVLVQQDPLLLIHIRHKYIIFLSLEDSFCYWVRPLLIYFYALM